MPVIKLTCSLKDVMEQEKHQYPKSAKYADIYYQNFSIDITHLNEGHNGVDCVKLVKEYLQEIWFLEPLILVLK